MYEIINYSIINKNNKHLSNIAIANDIPYICCNDKLYKIDILTGIKNRIILDRSLCNIRKLFSYNNKIYFEYGSYNINYFNFNTNTVEVFKHFNYHDYDEITDWCMNDKYIYIIGLYNDESYVIIYENDKIIYRISLELMGKYCINYLDTIIVICYDTLFILKNNELVHLSIIPFTINDSDCEDDDIIEGVAIDDNDNLYINCKNKSIFIYNIKSKKWSLIFETDKYMILGLYYHNNKLYLNSLNIGGSDVINLSGVIVLENKMDYLKLLYNNDSTKDLTILLNDNKTIMIHKLILQTKDTCFKKMLIKNNDENIIKIDSNYDIFSQIIEYIYLGKLTLTLDNLENIYIIADKYLIDDLIYYCEIYLNNTLDRENCIELLEKFKNTNNLYKIILRFIVYNLKKINKDYFLKIDSDHIQNIFFEIL